MSPSKMKAAGVRQDGMAKRVVRSGIELRYQRMNR